jgi:MoaA/NifB/PqqE/SkfB family radical SAM enzyme
MGHRIDIKVGYQCNNHCQFCVQGDKRYRRGDKTGAELAGILKKRRKDSDQVVFTGGEVTIRKDFFELVGVARDLGYANIQIQSNGRMFAYEDFCKKAVRAGANDFGLALHGSEKGIHDRLTLAPGSFNETVRGIKNLKKLGQKVILNTVINKINYKDLPDIARLLVSLGVDQFQFAFIHICKLIMEDPVMIRKIVPRKSQVKDFVKKGLQIGIDNHRVVMVEALPYCFMNGYEECISDRYIPPTSLEEDFFISDFDKVRREEGKIKGPRCPQCKHYVECEGPWKEYPHLFGWDEFKPIER